MEKTEITLGEITNSRMLHKLPEELKYQGWYVYGHCTFDQRGSFYTPLGKFTSFVDRETVILVCTKMKYRNDFKDWEEYCKKSGYRFVKVIEFADGIIGMEEENYDMSF